MRLAGEWQRKRAICGWERHRIAPFFTLTLLALLRLNKRIFGSFRGTLTIYSVYNQHPGRRQSCLWLILIDRSPKWSKEKESMHSVAKRVKRS